MATGLMGRRSAADRCSHALGRGPEPREDLRGEAVRIAHHRENKVLWHHGAVARGFVDEPKSFLRLGAERDLGRNARLPGWRDDLLGGFVVGRAETPIRDLADCARSVLTCRCSSPNQTLSLPETAST